MHEHISEAYYVATPAAANSTDYIVHIVDLAIQEVYQAITNRRQTLTDKISEFIDDFLVLGGNAESRVGQDS